MCCDAPCKRLQKNSIVASCLQVYFAPHAERLGDFGFELYAGEAMLALLAAHRRLGEPSYLASVSRALPQYERIYR